MRTNTGVQERQPVTTVLWRAGLRVAANPVVGIAVLALGVLSAYLAMRRLGEDAQWPYLYAYGFWHGEPIFTEQWRLTHQHALTGFAPNGFAFFWPAAMGIVMLPLAAFSFESARVVLLLLCVTALGVGVWAIFSLARPTTPWPTRLTVIGLVLLMACSRWCWHLVQIGPLLAGLLVATLYGLRRNRIWMAYLATTLVFAIKPTLCIPFVLLLILHRRYRTILLAIATNLVLNIIGFLRYGGIDAVNAYRAGTATLEARGGVNTPDFWDRASIPRVDWTYLGTGLTGNFGFARVVALLVGGALVVFLCLACLRNAQPPSLVDSCRIMLAGTFVGLVVVYHHHYDLTMLLPGLLLAALLHRELGLTWSRWVTWSFAPLTLMMLLLPAGWGPTQAAKLVGDRGAGLVNAAFPAATTLALAGSLALVVEATGSVADWKAWLATPGRLRFWRTAT